MLEAKDTVMKTVEELRPYHFTEGYTVGEENIRITEEQWDIPKLLLAQAEKTWPIAFKAGMEECTKTHFKPDWKIRAKDLQEATKESFQAGKQEGIKEVVEWIKKHSLTDSNNLHVSFRISWEEWQGQLKKWQQQPWPLPLSFRSRCK